MYDLQRPSPLDNIRKQDLSLCLRGNYEAAQQNYNYNLPAAIRC